MNQLICNNCQKSFSLDEKIWRCTCGGVLDIEFESIFPKDKIVQRKRNMWRYREAIPINDDNNIVSFNEGSTPLLNIDFDGKSVLIKQDQLFNTGSYKDRGASVLISKIKELGINNVLEDSSGNAGCAIAAYCAKANITCEIFVPSNTVPGKTIQIESYGAKLNKVMGTREDTADTILRVLFEKNEYYASHSWNPFFFQGTKTFAFEICEQLDWTTPDSIVLPVGNGTLILGTYLGFNDLLNAGIIDNIPKIIGVQSSNCAPLYNAYTKKSNEVLEIEKKFTIAEGIAIAEPVRGKQILEVVNKNNGVFISVAEHEILEALKTTCNKGFFIEPTAAVTIAGLNQYLNQIDDEENVVSVFTGHGLKTIDKIMKIFD